MSKCQVTHLRTSSVSENALYVLEKRPCETNWQQLFDAVSACGIVTPVLSTESMPCPPHLERPE